MWCRRCESRRTHSQSPAPRDGAIARTHGGAPRCRLRAAGPVTALSVEPAARRVAGGPYIRRTARGGRSPRRRRSPERPYRQSDGANGQKDSPPQVDLARAAWGGRSPEPYHEGEGGSGAEALIPDMIRLMSRSETASGTSNEATSVTIRSVFRVVS